MFGKVTYVLPSGSGTGTGAIQGDDGKEYRFSQAVVVVGVPVVGDRVSFNVQGGAPIAVRVEE